MSTIADLLIKVSADTDPASKDISSFGSKVGKGFSKALLPAVAALGVMGVVGKMAFANLQDGAKNAKQTEQVIKTTGSAANVTAQHVDTLSNSLRRKAGVDDDVVHIGANMLLTFTNVRNEVGKGNAIFDQATTTALDMSVALGQDVKNSALQLGKALNDPIKGVGALSRVGVTFTEDQKEQIKTLVQGKTALQALGDMGIKVAAPAIKALGAATAAGLSPTQALEKAHIELTGAQASLFKKATEGGHTLEAQKIILAELGKEFGGAATNIDPMQRSMANLKLDALDMASALISGLMPAFQIVIGVLQRATSFMTEHQTAVKSVVGALAGLAIGVVAVNAGMKLYAAGAVIVKAATAAWTAVQWLLNAALTANPIGLVIVALVALGAGLLLAWKKSETFRDVVKGALDAVRAAAVRVASFFTKDIPAAFRAVIDWLRANWPLIATIIAGPFAPLVALATNAFGIRSALTGALGRILGDVRSKFQAVSAFISGWAGTAYAYAFRVGSSIVDGIIGGLGSLLGRVTGAVVGGLLGAVGAAGKALTGSGPFQFTIHAVGVPMGAGVIEGFLLGTATLPAKMAEKLRDAIEVGRQEIDASRSIFSSAFGGLAEVADRAFDAIASTVKTKSEKMLAALTAAHDKAAAVAALGAARSDLTAAQQSLAGFAATDDMTPEAAAQKMLELGAAVKAAQDRVNDLLYQQKVAALQARSAAERLNLDARTAIQKQHFDAALANLSASLAKEGATSGQAAKSVLKLLGSFGVDFKGVGASMGAAWAEGLRNAIAAAAKSAGALSGVVGQTAGKIKIPGHAAGVRNFGGGLAVVGEGGPELVNLPRGSSVFSNADSRAMTAGGRTLTVHVNGAQAQPLDEGRLLDLLRRAEALA